MANIKPALDKDELKKIGSLTKMKAEYARLAEQYTKFIDGEMLRCPKCGEIMKADTAFYFDKSYTPNRYPICKRCIQKMVEQKVKDTDEPNETKASVQRVLQMMDRVYDDEFYSNCVKGAEEGLKEKNRTSPWATYITAISSLPNWKGMTWKDSKFGDLGESADQATVNENSRIIKNAKKRFGSSYEIADLLFLEQEYQDWVTRYECNTKAQEAIFERLAFKKWEINKATKAGQPTKDLDKTYQELLATANIQPRQSTSDLTSGAQTFGTLIQKYEETRPLPDIDPELEDIDKIGLYVDTFFRGHTLKALGLKNTFTQLYDKVMRKYTVTKPQYAEEADDEVLFGKIFNSVEDY